jgi:hypothetical protein
MWWKSLKVHFWMNNSLVDHSIEKNIQFWMDNWIFFFEVFAVFYTFEFEQKIEKKKNFLKSLQNINENEKNRKEMQNIKCWKKKKGKRCTDVRINQFKSTCESFWIF